MSAEKLIIEFVQLGILLTTKRLFTAAFEYELTYWPLGDTNEILDK